MLHSAVLVDMLLTVKKYRHFLFFLENPTSKEKWIKFVNRFDWLPTKNSLLCMKQLEEKFILKEKRKKLNWDLHPIPTIHSEKIRKLSLLPYRREFGKPPKQRLVHTDELHDFISADMINNFTQLEEAKCCSNVIESWKKKKDYIIIYGIVFDHEAHFPSIKECICIDQNIYVHLQCDGDSILLPYKI